MRVTSCCASERRCIAAARLATNNPPRFSDPTPALILSSPLRSVYDGCAGVTSVSCRVAGTVETAGKLCPVLSLALTGPAVAVSGCQEYVAYVFWNTGSDGHSGRGSDADHHSADAAG